MSGELTYDPWGQPGYTINENTQPIPNQPPDPSAISQAAPWRQNLPGGAQAVPQGATGMDATATGPAQPQHHWRQVVGDLLANFGRGMAQASQARTSGQAFLGGFGGALVAPEDRAVEKRKLDIAQSSADSMAAYHKALAEIATQNSQLVPVQTPDGTTVMIPQKSAYSVINKGIGAQTSAANTDKKVVAENLKNGYDKDGKPLPIDSLSIPTHLKAVLPTVQQQLTQARIDAMNADPNTPAGQVARQKLAIAQQHANAASAMVGIAGKNAGTNYSKYLADYFGTDASGQALPGAPTTASGQPMGVKTASANNPTADRARRGDLAANAIQNLSFVENVAKTKPEMFGKIGGTYSSVDQMLGSDDPDVVAVGQAMHQYAIASNGAHGIRSARGIADTENKLLRGFRTGAKGLQGGIDQSRQSLQDFVNDQQLGKRARPSGASINPPVKPAADPLKIF